MHINSRHPASRSLSRAAVILMMPTVVKAILVFVLALVSIAAHGMAGKGAVEAGKDRLDAILGGSPAATGGAPSNGQDAAVAPAAAAPDGLVASGNYARPTLDGLTVAAEGPGMASLYRWTRAASAWKGGLVVSASPATAGRCYVPRLAGGVMSWRWGNKEAGKLHGPGLLVGGRILYPGLTEGAARLALTPAGVVLMSKNTEWGLLDASGAVIKRGTFSPGMSTGEKFGFRVDGQTWAVCHNGWSGQPSALAYGTSAGAIRRVTWADRAVYPSQGDDLNYPALAIHSGAFWCASVLAGQLRVNCYRKGGLRWPATALPTLGPATLQERCPPALVTDGGRLWAVWCYKGQIMLADVERVIKRKAKPIVVTRGDQPAAQSVGDKVVIVHRVDGGVRAITIL